MKEKWIKRFRWGCAVFWIIFFLYFLIMPSVSMVPEVRNAFYCYVFRSSWTKEISVKPFILSRDQLIEYYRDQGKVLPIQEDISRLEGQDVNLLIVIRSPQEDRGTMWVRSPSLQRPFLVPFRVNCWLAPHSFRGATALSIDSSALRNTNRVPTFKHKFRRIIAK